MYERVQIQVSALNCRCDQCGYPWVSQAAAPPKWCANPKCRSRKWNGATRPILSGEIKFPAPRKPGRPKSINLIPEGEDN